MSSPRLAEISAVKIYCDLLSSLRLTNFGMGLLYNYNSFSLRRTNKHPSSGPNLLLNLFFTEFMFFITLSRHSQKHNFSTFSSKIYSWTSLQFIFSPLNFFHRPVFRPVPRTLGNSHRVSNSHLTFSTVLYKN